MNALAETFEAAGFVGPVLLLCAILMWYAIGARWFALRRPSGRTIEALIEGAPEGRTFMDAAIRAALQEAHRHHPATLGHIEGALTPYRLLFRANGAVVQSATAVAPLAGLLGTVTGMIETFDSLGTMELFSKGGGIGAGISEAMISTQMGLVVAVPGLLLGAMLDRRQAVMEDELDAVAERLVRNAALEEVA